MPHGGSSRLVRALAAAVIVAATLVLPASPAAAQDWDLTTVFGPASQDGTSTIDWSPGNVDTPTPNAVEEAGDDLSLSNRRVRTLDVTTFQVGYSVFPLVSSPQPSGDIVLELTVTGGARIREGWSASACTVQPGRAVVLCAFGSFTFAVTDAFPVDVVAPASMLNGSTFALVSTISETGTSEEDSVTSPSITVSSAPRFELVKQTFGPGNREEVGNGMSTPSGPGFLQRFVIGVRGLAASRSDCPPCASRSTSPT